MKKRDEVYNTYWYYAAERQNIFFKKLMHNPAPYSSDPIFQKFKFCNTYRASDRVSQFLIKDVIYPANFSAEDTALRILLFRFLNKIETWVALEKQLGEYVTVRNFHFQKFAKILEKMKEKQAIYGSAFILASTRVYGLEKKHENHLALMEDLFMKHPQKGMKLLQSKSLGDLYENLHELPMIGNFMAYQMAIDLNYSDLFDFSENDFTMAGPGAERGIAKCFTDLEDKSKEYVIMWMVEHQDDEFRRLGIQFQSLWGRPLQAIDCQNVFCETDKYCREKFPDMKSNRSRIKVKYAKTPGSVTYFYPPKWGINNKIKQPEYQEEETLPLLSYLQHS